MAGEKKLILFDFDGTITTRDTLLEFIRFYHGMLKFIIGFSINAPAIILSKLTIIPNWRAKELVLTWFFKNEDIDRFNARCEVFATQNVPSLIRPKALVEIDNYLKTGSYVMVVSASAENWVKPWCDAMGIHCIATRLEVEKNKLTGKIAGKNCYGPQKTIRIKEQTSLNKYEEVVVYGDSAGDREMFLLGDKKFYKPFRN